MAKEKINFANFQVIIALPRGFPNDIMAASLTGVENCCFCL